MNPQCIECAKIVAIGKGITTEITSSRPVFGKDNNKVYLCSKCNNKIEIYKTAKWYENHKII